MEQPEEIPYPVQAVMELAGNFNREHFEYAITQCRNVISQVLAEGNSSEQQIARVRVLTYVNLQLARAVRWIDQEADLMALVLRSLIELRFWAHFVSQGNDKAKRFLEEANTDSKDIYERLLKAFPEETTPYTSFVLDTPETTILNEDYRKVFAVKVLYYGWGILEIFHPINWTD